MRPTLLAIRFQKMRLPNSFGSGGNFNPTASLPNLMQLTMRVMMCPLTEKDDVSKFQAA